MNTKFFTAIISSLFISALISCSSPPEKVKLEDLCNEKYKDEEVVTEGVIYLPSQMYTFGNMMSLGIMNEKTDQKVPYLNIASYTEKTPNSMKPLPQDYTEKDVHIYDNEGNEVKLGTRVRITGTLRGASKAICYVAIDKIEKIQ